jgi:hypothetical protein
MSHDSLQHCILLVLSRTEMVAALNRALATEEREQCERDVIWLLATGLITIDYGSVRE